MDARFWFVGLLEELDLSMAVFCALGAHCGGGGGSSLGGKTKRGGRGRRVLLRGESDGHRRSGEGYGYDGFDDRDDGDDGARGDDGEKEAERPRDGTRGPGDAGLGFGMAALGGRRRSLLQKHSAKPEGFKLDDVTRKEVRRRKGIFVFALRVTLFAPELACDACLAASSQRPPSRANPRPF